MEGDPEVDKMGRLAKAEAGIGGVSGEHDYQKNAKGVKTLVTGRGRGKTLQFPG